MLCESKPFTLILRKLIGVGNRTVSPVSENVMWKENVLLHTDCLLDPILEREIGRIAPALLLPSRPWQKTYLDPLWAEADTYPAFLTAHEKAKSSRRYPVASSGFQKRSRNPDIRSTLRSIASRKTSGAAASVTRVLARVIAV